MIFVMMISYTDCKHIQYNSKWIEKWNFFDIHQSEALCDMLDVKRNLLTKVEEHARHGCPLQDLDKPHFYGVDSTVKNSYPKSAIRSKF